MIGFICGLCAGIIIMTAFILDTKNLNKEPVKAELPRTIQELKELTNPYVIEPTDWEIECHWKVLDFLQDITINPTLYDKTEYFWIYKDTKVWVKGGKESIHIKEGEKSIEVTALCREILWYYYETWLLTMEDYIQKQHVKIKLDSKVMLKAI